MSKDRGRRREVLTSVGLWIRSPFLRRQWPSIRNCIISLRVADGSPSSLIEFVMCRASFFFLNLLLTHRVAYPSAFCISSQDWFRLGLFSFCSPQTRPGRCCTCSRMSWPFFGLLEFCAALGLCHRRRGRRTSGRRARVASSRSYVSSLQFVHEFSRRVRSKHPI